MTDDLFSDFVSRWAVEGSLPPAEIGDIDELEKAAGLKLPLDYVDFVTTHGFPYTPDILDVVSEQELDLYDVQNFEAIESILATTSEYERAGMSVGYIAFAGDCMGNLFLFKKTECDGNQDASVWVFDHDFVSFEQVAPSFKEWLAQYVDVAADG